MATEPQIYNDSFTEMGSISDLKSVPSSPANSPIHSETELESPIKEKSWPKYKRFKDQSTGEEAVYELISCPSDKKQPLKQQPQKGILSLCNDLVTFSSISLVVASNLLAFTFGMLVGKRMAYEF